MPPRQVLIEAKIYEVTLTGDLAKRCSGVPDARRARHSGRHPAGYTEPCWHRRARRYQLSVGTLVGASRELLALINASEFHTKARVVSAPSVIATDSIPASINVGDEVPTLTAQAVTGAQQAELAVRQQHSVPQ